MTKEEIIIGDWGTAIFSDDLACDVRDDYKYLLGEGYDNDKAIEILMKDYNELLNDPDDCPVFWLALATTQWKLGRLRDDIKRKAIEIIENNNDLNRWRWADNVKLKEKRRIVLEKLKKQLNTPQCSIKKVSKVFKQYTNFKMGDIICYSYNTGEKIFLKTVWINEHYKGDRYPIFEAYQWVGMTIPPLDEVVKYPIAKWVHTSLFSVYMKNKKDYPGDRIEIIGHVDFEIKPIDGGYSLFAWCELDEKLKTLFRLI